MARAPRGALSARDGAAFLEPEAYRARVQATPIDLDALARVHDEESRDVFVSLYADLSDDRHEDKLARRAREIRAALDEEEREAFDAALEAAREGLHAAKREQGARGAAAFAAPTHGFQHAHALPEPIETRLVLDSSPYVRPLARYVDEHEPFVLALLDGEHAAIYLVDAEGPERQESKSLSLLGRHKKGGMSQMRYQRHRQGAVERMLEDVAQRIDRLLEEGEARRVVLAGPGPAKAQLRERLSARAKERVFAEEDVDLDGDGLDDDLVERFVALAKDDEAEASQRAARTLRRELRKGELATTGPFEVVRAARDGRVELLLVDKDEQAGAAKCEEHAAYFEQGARCRACGSEGTEVELLNEAVEHAIQTEARVEFVEDDTFLREVGGVGAILRW